jgi:hypothetical protein
MFTPRSPRLCAGTARRAAAIVVVGGIMVVIQSATTAFAQGPGRGGPPDRGGAGGMGEGARGGGRPAMARLEDEIAQLREALSNAENQIRDLTRRVTELSRGNADGQAGSRAERRFGPRDGDNLDAWRELGRRMGGDGRPDRPRGPAFADRGPRPGRGPQSDFGREPPRFAGGPPGPRDGFRDGGRFRDGGPERRPAIADRSMGPPRGDRSDATPAASRDGGGGSMPNVVARLEQIENRLDALIRVISDRRPAPQR